VRFYAQTIANNLEFTIWGYKVEKGNKTTDWTPAPEDMATQAQLSVLNDNINLRVEKGDVINQINISDENILIQANKIMALGDVVVDGKLTITDEFIAPNAQIDGAKIADATINSAKINDLDVNKISGNTTSFVSSAWNSNNASVFIDPYGVHSVSGLDTVTLRDGALWLDSNSMDYPTSVLLDGVGLRFATAGKNARIRFNGTNIVMDNGSLGMNRNHINSVDWIRIIGQEGDTMDTAIFNSPNHPGSIIADTRQITIGHGSRAEVTRVASFAGSIHFMKNLYMDGNNINDIFAVRLSGTSTMLTGSIGSLGGGALIDRTAITIGLRNGSTDESRAFDRVAEFYVRIHIDRKLAYNG